MLLAGSLIAFGVFTLLYILSWLNGCAAASPVVNDAITIEARDAACIAENYGEPDAIILARCSPAGDQTTTQKIQVVLSICHAAHTPPPVDAGRE
jgi:hypothetical protein